VVPDNPYLLNYVALSPYTGTLNQRCGASDSGAIAITIDEVSRHVTRRLCLLSSARYTVDRQ
jgi:hypothetical protein